MLGRGTELLNIMLLFLFVFCFSLEENQAKPNKNSMTLVKRKCLDTAYIGTERGDVVGRGGGWTPK